MDRCTVNRCSHRAAFDLKITTSHIYYGRITKGIITNGRITSGSDLTAVVTAAIDDGQRTGAILLNSSLAVAIQRFTV